MQRQETSARRDLVLVGGGHAHVAVIRAFGMHPQDGTRLTIISRDIVTPYSGMLPGYLAGHYTHGECHIDLRPLARFAGARLIHGAVSGLDLAGGKVLIDGRPGVRFDAVSLDLGSTPPETGIDGASHALPVKPVDRFLARWAEKEALIHARLTAGEPARLVVVGGGAGGIEVAMALRCRILAHHSARAASHLDIRVVAASDQPMAGHGPAVRRAMARALIHQRIAFSGGRRVLGIEPDGVRLDSDERFDSDATILVTGAAAPTWLQGTGLALDTRGFIRVDAHLRSVTDGRVFAAGDIAAIDGHPVPKSGVYAVRAGPVLAANLRRSLDGRPLRRFRPQGNVLGLISTGGKYAIAARGGWTLEGAWLWQVKDWIDRAFMRRYQELPAMAATTTSPDAAVDGAMRCGGCGAKVESAVLARVLTRIGDTRDAERGDHVLLGLAGMDDAAVLRVPDDKMLVQSVDQLKPILDDPWLFGRVAALHALSDLFAMGAEPASAQALVTLPRTAEGLLEEDLFQLLSGAVMELRRAGAVLVGGHTSEGAEVALGFAVNGLVSPDRLTAKTGVRLGDRLILTKPLGIGVLFAAEMRGKASGDEIDGAVASMLRSNADAARILQNVGATAMTDVTGFGVIGHLIGMLGGAGAILDPDRLPALPGAIAHLERGLCSSLTPSNEAFAQHLVQDIGASGPRGLLFDPQTSGGLLAAVASERSDDAVQRLVAAGDTHATIIGEVSAEPGIALRRV